MAKTNDPELERYTQELWDTIMRIIHSFRTGMGVWEEMGLTFPQTMLLIELRRGGRLSMGELSQRLHITQGVTTRMVDLLLEKKLVERSRDKEDRRVVFVGLSRKGAGIAQQVEEYNQEKMAEMLAAVPEKDKEFLLGFLKGLQRQFEKEGTA
ncbi:MAG: MarR family transcriptional regulator [Actinomycetota bacterium]